MSHSLDERNLIKAHRPRATFSDYCIFSYWKHSPSAYAIVSPWGRHGRSYELARDQSGVITDNVSESVIPIPRSDWDPAQIPRRTRPYATWVLRHQIKMIRSCPLTLCQSR